MKIQCFSMDDQIMDIFNSSDTFMSANSHRSQTDHQKRKKKQNKEISHTFFVATANGSVGQLARVNNTPKTPRLLITF